VLDYPAVAEALLPSFAEWMGMQIGDTYFLRRGRYNHQAGRTESDYTLIRDGKVESRPWTQRVYTFRQVCEIVGQAGFGEVQGFGSIGADAFKLGARGLLLVMTKNS
jgi:hypothetical protein